jgi:exopolysaccharide production protein ExoZ
LDGLRASAQSSSDFTIHTTLPPSAKTGQIDGVQILRAAAVFLVAWLHAGQQLDKWRVRELPHFAAFGIDIFFVISGFIMSLVLLRTRQGPGIQATWYYLKRRLIRIFPIYWVFAILESVRLLHSHSFAPHFFPSFLLLPGLFPRYPLVVGFSWTMIFEMFFYYVLALVLLVTVKRAVAVSIAIIGFTVLLGEVIDVHSPALVVISSPILLEFILGAVVALAFVRFGQQRGVGVILLVAGVAASLYMRAYPDEGGAAGIDMVLSSVGAFRHVLTWGMAAALIVAGVIFWSPAIHGRVGRIAVILGNASYSAYLVSGLLIEFTARLLIRLGGHAPPSVRKEALVQFMLVVTVFIGGWVSYQFLEWPMIRWLQAKF